MKNIMPAEQSYKIPCLIHNNQLMNTVRFHQCCRFLEWNLFVDQMAIMMEEFVYHRLPYLFLSTPVSNISLRNDSDRMGTLKNHPIIAFTFPHCSCRFKKRGIQSKNERRTAHCFGNDLEFSQLFKADMS